MLFLRFSLLFCLVFQATGVSADIRKWSKSEWDFLYEQPLLLPPLCGVAVSEYQVRGQDGCPHSNWAAWEAKAVHNGHPTINNNDWSGNACDFQNMWHDDIGLITDIGCNAFRFSVEWSNIEPEEGIFCQEALDEYIDIVDALLQAGIVPMITLHHFTHPQWFEDKGGFAHEANIYLFVRFCEYVFTRLSDRVHLWCTINEIGPFVFQGYVHGAFPPGKTMALREAALVIRNMLRAHCDVYRALKKLPGGDKAQIGLVHQYLPVEAHSSWCSSLFKAGGGYALLMALSNPRIGTYDHTLQLGNSPRPLYYAGDPMFLSHLPIFEHPTVSTALTIAKYTIAAGAVVAGFNLMERVPAWFMGYLFNDAMLHFLKTGVLFPCIPFMRMTIEDAPECYDFIGLNLYSRVVMRSRVCDALLGREAPDPANPIVYPTGKESELMTDMPYAICPEALYEGIVEMSKLGKPIYITENGAPDRYDVYRGFYIKSYLYALSRALYDGYDVRGLFYWSFMDNFEWDMGYNQKFGLYEVDFDTKKRTLRKGAEVYRDAVKTALRTDSGTPTTTVVVCGFVCDKEVLL
jgi:beta-glucosidase/6-phospho-beta-glucosidase/beta-galactosidase